MTVRTCNISVVVPWHSGCPFALSVIRQIRAILPDHGEVLAVRDGPGPALKLAGVEELALTTNEGPAAARNLGAKFAKHTWLFFTDSDVWVPPGFFDKLASTLRCQPARSAVIGSYDADPASSTTISQYRNLLHHFTHQYFRGQPTGFWTGCGAIRRDEFLELGGFDSHRYRKPSIEDVEFGFRWCNDGRAIHLEKALQVKHLKRWTLMSTVKTDLLSRAGPWSALMLEGRAPCGLQTSIRDQIAVGLAFGSILSLFIAVAKLPTAIVVTVSIVVSWVFVRRKFLNFLMCKRGTRFMLKALPLYYLFHLLAACGFVLALLGIFSANEHKSNHSKNDR